MPPFWGLNLTALRPWPANKGAAMHKHQQTIADLERVNDPSMIELAVYGAILLAATLAATVFCFSF